MAKKRSWLFLLKKLFVSGTEPKQEKKDKRRKWILFGRAKIRGKPFPIALPSPPVEKTRDAPEPNEEQKRQARCVAAAEAERAATHYAAEHQEHAAINIQTAFRRYLARKALRALKGIVKLQAIIRGQNLRRQAMHTLKCLQSIVNIHSQACAKRTEVAAKSWNIIKMDMNSPRRWDSSALTKEEADALFISKKDAAFKRGRVREYAFNHRNSAETDRNKVNGRWKYWLDQWVDTQVSKSKELEDLDSVLTTSNLKPRVEYRGKQLNSPMLVSRRSLHRKQCSLGEDNSFSGSPSVPTYMAATESAKAKSRSLSSPRLRPGNYDAYSDSHSPCKNRFKVVPSHGKFSTYQQRSPSLKGIIAGPIKSSMALKDLSFDSECSFKTWHQETAFRC